ncbi:tyrosyl-DNA phosphodiesterase 1-like [Lineus longissimus]|uniref:tyrosyl-DNA phosphodiesterase 1-like n=1 Tax=Lineus longissimus TaxID=88925 RepID=UPI002B4DFF01
MSDDSDVTLDPDQDSDRTVGPSDEEEDGASNAVTSASKPDVCSLKQPLQKRKSLPYQFKKTSSSVHTISDSGSDEEPPRKATSASRPSQNLKPSPKPKLSPKSSSSSRQSYSSNRSLLLISDSVDESPRKSDGKKPISTNKSTLSPKQSVAKKSIQLVSDSDSDDTKRNAPEKSSKRSLSLAKKPPSGDDVRNSLRGARPSPAKKQDSGGTSKNTLSKTNSTPKQDSRNRSNISIPIPGSSKRAREVDVPLSSSQVDPRPVCPYGDKCYRKNPEHRKEFRHIDSVRASPPPKKKPKIDVPNMDVTEKYKNGRPFNFFLTTVHGIEKEYNAKLAFGIKDILSPKMGSLEASVQFNYMTDIPWLVQQYPAEFRTKPLLIVHGEQRQSKAAIDLEASRFSHIKLCQAKLEIMYGTHHTKMMLLLYKEGLRVVIHTSNLIQQDWHQKTQGIWISPLFPKLSNPSDKGDSITMFKHDLLQYLGAYGSNRLTEWEKHIREHDMSKAKVYIIGSIPGRHRGDAKSRYGHLKLRQVLQRKGPQSRDVHGWPVVGQFSSIGSMGANKENWLCGEWLQSLGAGQGDSTGLGHPKLQLIYPSKDNVRLSLEGYPAGGSLPYSIKTAQKQTFLHAFFHVWKSAVRGRSQASPHIKTYSRMSPNGDDLAWFLVTSANLSKAAWGALEKSGSQLMIRSYELGVLFLPDHFGDKTFKTLKNVDDYFPGSSTFPVPYDLPPQPYTRQDKPWIWDIPYTDLPDTNGNAWCPPS